MNQPLGSAPLPAPGPEDHVRGPSKAKLVIVYADYECPFCAVTELRLAECEVQICFRHFPIRSKHPRAWAAAQAAEAAGLQGRFWEMHEALFADQGRLEDPHLWARAEALGLDVERFDTERRSPAVISRIKRDFSSGIRGGIATTPTVAIDGRLYPGIPSPQLLADAQ
ncbi:MAG: DsbA family protein [Solirubrobacterales bacterium]|nr:DsbA family protein [Solirubrobacterales bacterium]